MLFSFTTRPLSKEDMVLFNIRERLELFFVYRFPKFFTLMREVSKYIPPSPAALFGLGNSML